MPTRATPRSILCTSLLLVGVALVSASAVAADKPLKESAVTERALIEALAPVPAPAAAPSPDGDVTRGFKLAPAAPAPPRKQSILITFDTNSAELLPRTKEMLAIVAKALKSERLAAQKVVVEGHADPRGAEAANQRLSSARAQSVVDYLVSQQGIGADRLTAVGKGSAELMNGRLPSAPENRRVSLVTQGQ